MELEQVVDDVATALVSIDRCGAPFKKFQRGVGPYGEPQLLAAIARHLNTVPSCGDSVRTKRTPDLLIPERWALEFKLARPFGDNGKEAENWSVNLLHPYEGNVSLIGDCLKLQRLGGVERKGVVVVGYEHTPPRIPLAPLVDAFELVACKVAGVRIGRRVQAASGWLVPSRSPAISRRGVGSTVPHCRTRVKGLRSTAGRSSMPVSPELSASATASGWCRWAFPYTYVGQRRAVRRDVFLSPGI